MEALRQSNSVGTYQLAHIILFEAFKRQHIGGDIVLSAEMTGMGKHKRRRAIRELIKLELIKVDKNGNGEAYRVISIY
jgi:predicted transcriptional regulator